MLILYVVWRYVYVPIYKFIIFMYYYCLIYYFLFIQANFFENMKKFLYNYEYILYIYIYTGIIISSFVNIFVISVSNLCSKLKPFFQFRRIQHLNPQPTESTHRAITSSTNEEFHSNIFKICLLLCCKGILY